MPMRLTFLKGRNRKENGALWRRSNACIPLAADPS
jgi:hypothetical protein